MKSQNSIILTGRLTADAQELSNNSGVRFTLAHNMGKDQKALFVDFTFFAKNGKFENKIPRDLLKKGQAVTVSAYMKPNTFTKADGKEVTEIQYLVKKVEELVFDNASEEEADE